jgi:type I restriction-modification system DNA methylase subunit
MPRIRRSADQHPELGLPEVRKLWQTEGLFSDHYLKARIRSNSWWPTDEETRPLWEFSKALYEKRAFALRRFDNEMGVRQEFIDKILGKLGFAWSDNLRLPETRQELEPDYLLYASDGEKETVLDKDVAHRYRAAISILEAKRFGHPLSQFSKSQQRYPHQQIRQYLDEAQVFSWGILTNGEQWRLYCRDTKPSHFFAINFELAIKSLEDFKFFFALFSPVAFKRDAQGECRLDDVRKSALDAQSKLEEDLRQRVFTIVEILANGFAEREQNAITDSAESRRELYGNCLIFLYRLLFVLYAEGRMLLPVERSDRKYYKDFSLAALRGSLRSFSEFDSPHLTRLNDKIVGLCRLINGTDEKLNKAYSVPLYNGGLFAPERHLLLEKWRVSDAVLADVLRGLMFNPQPERDKPALPIETVDFGDLRVQQLGSIYEGLLEHHFVREGARLVLKTDKAERKATGTYYTPDYIVKYIVEQTVGPLVAEIDERESVKKAREAGSKDNSFAREALGLNILDPAMGSGHFLVEATTFLADEIAAHPTTQPLSEKSKDEDEIAHWRRRVVESCIYGVDLNPLAVELAKLSLWLTTIATDQPLNFLDHHFCCGNSLVGARIGDLGHVPELKKKKNGGFKFTWKITDNLLAAVQKAVRNVKQIEERTSETVGDVKNKERIWSDSVRPALRPFRSVANVWLACFFGNDLPQRDYEALIELLDIHPEKVRPWKNAGEFQEIVIDAVTKGELKLAGRDFDKNQLKNLCAFLIRAENSAHERRFFHWELEFPEVFFNDDGTPRESPGFDAVVGNPPYGTISDKQHVPFMQRMYPSFEGNLENYGLFTDRAVSLCQNEQMVGLIVPVTWCQNPQFSKLRSILLTWSLEKLVELPTKVFSGSDLDTSIFILQKAASSANSITFVLSCRDATTLDPSQWKERARVSKSDWVDAGGKFSFDFNAAEVGVLKRIRGVSEPLSHFFDFSQGLVPYAREELYSTLSKAEADQIVDERLWHSDRKATPEFKPELRGDDVGRYRVTWNEKQWIKYGPWLARPRESRFFNGPRVLIQEITRGRTLRAGFTDEEFYNNPGIINIAPKRAKTKAESPSLLFLVALCNSALFFFWHTRNSPKAKLVTSIPKILVEDVARLPVRCIDFTTPATKREAQLDKAKQLCEKSLAGNDAEDALQFVEAELNGGRTDVVHDLLAFLAERMMAMTQEKRTTAKQFLTDLKDFHGIDVRALNPKTKLEEFWKLEAADVFAHLRKNTKVLAAQNVRLSGHAEEKIRARFSKSKSTLVLLDAQIAFTDRFIDEIVYRLYGLTQGERRIVEAN